MAAMQKVLRERKITGQGFGDDIPWLCFEKALAEAKLHNVPIMMIFHKSWCSACKALKPQVADCKEFKVLSRQFVMVNVGDNDEPSDSKYAPDGTYIPRILFLRPNGEVMYEFYNIGGHPEYKFYYSDSKSIIRSMQRVLNSGLSSTKILDEL